VSSSKKKTTKPTRIAYHKLSVHDELLTPEAIEFKDVVVGEFFVRVYGGTELGVSSYVLYQKIITNHYVYNDKPMGKIMALRVMEGTDMFMPDTEPVVPVEVAMSLHLACFCSHTGATG